MTFSSHLSIAVLILQAWLVFLKLHQIKKSTNWIGYVLNKQLPDIYNCQNSYFFFNFWKIQRKTPVSESLFHKAVGHLFYRTPPLAATEQQIFRTTTLVCREKHQPSRFSCSETQLKENSYLRWKDNKIIPSKHLPVQTQHH